MVKFHDTDTVIAAKDVKVGDRISVMSDDVFFEIKAVRIRYHETRFGWSGGRGVELDTGWGTTILHLDDSVVREGRRLGDD